MPCYATVVVRISWYCCVTSMTCTRRQPKTREKQKANKEVAIMYCCISFGSSLCYCSCLLCVLCFNVVISDVVLWPVCVLYIKPFFLLVHIQHTKCSRWFFILERCKLWSQNYDTSRYVVDNSINIVLMDQVNKSWACHFRLFISLFSHFRQPE